MMWFLEGWAPGHLLLVPSSLLQLASELGALVLGLVVAWWGIGGFGDKAYGLRGEEEAGGVQ